jgi:lipoyl(octanoyl) transferase
VYTVGQAGRSEHLPRNDQTGVRRLPLSKSIAADRSTYHGPGQLVVYTLLDLRRLGLGIREVVSQLEQAVIQLLASYALQAERKSGAPGVYVDGAKIAALGLQVRNGCCYHGLSLNIDMDLSPCLAIDPCGYRGMPVTQLRSLGVVRSVSEAGSALLPHLQECLGLRHAPTAHQRSPWLNPPTGNHGMTASDSKEKGASKTARIPIKIVAAEKLPKPDWIRVKAPSEGSALWRNQDHPARKAPAHASVKRPPAPTSANALARARPPS